MQINAKKMHNSGNDPFWKSPCRYSTFIWHFEMLMKCNAYISIPGAMRNVNEMQMKCK